MKNSFNINKMLGFFIGLYIISLPLFSFREGYYMLTNLIAGITVLLFLVKVLLNNGRMKISPFFFFFFTFIVFGAFTYLYAINKEYVLQQSITLFLNAILCLAIYNYIDNRNKIEILMKYFICGNILAILVLYFTTNIFSGDRVGSILGNVNMIAMFLGISTIFTIYFTLKYKKYIYILLCVIFILFILLTGSRKGVLLLILYFPIYIISVSKKRFIGILKSILVISLIGGFFIFIVSNNSLIDQIIGKRFNSLLNYVSESGSIDSSIIERDYFIRLGFKKFTERPVLGYGLGNFKEVLIRSGYYHITYSHNNFIELLVGVGLIGTSLFYSMYLWFFLKIRHVIQLRDKLSSIFFVLNLVIIILGWSMVHYYDKLFYLLLVLGNACLFWSEDK